MPMRTGTGHASAGCPGSGVVRRGPAGRRPPGRTRAGRRAAAASCRSVADLHRASPTRTVGTDSGGRDQLAIESAGGWPTARHSTAPRSSAPTARVRGGSSVAAPGTAWRGSTPRSPSPAPRPGALGRGTGVRVRRPARGVAARHGDGEGPPSTIAPAHRPVRDSGWIAAAAGNDHGDQDVEAQHPEREIGDVAEMSVGPGSRPRAPDSSVRGGDRRQPRRRRRHPPPPLAVDRALNLETARRRVHHAYRACSAAFAGRPVVRPPAARNG